MPEVERPKALHGRKANRAFIWQECGAVQGVVRKISLMVRMGSNPHHSWLGLSGRQNLTFDKGGKGVGDFRGIVRFWKGLVGVKQSLRLDGRKVCNIERVGISQAESNKATVCGLPSIHLPLTREASVVVRSKG